MGSNSAPSGHSDATAIGGNIPNVGFVSQPVTVRPVFEGTCSTALELKTET